MSRMESVDPIKRPPSCEITSPGREIFSHHGVGYETSNIRGDDLQNGGTLSIVVYSFGKCIEWKPNEVSVGTDSEQEWAMVDNATSRTKTSSDGSESAVNRLLLPFKVPLVDLKSYTVYEQKRKLVLHNKDKETKYVFVFQYENADCFTKALGQVVKTRRSRRDRHRYNILGERADPAVLAQSFSELNLFSDTRKDTVWKFVNDLKSSPYETTLTTFSKISEYFLYKMPQETRDDDFPQMSSRLTSSTEGAVGIAQQNNENLKDYHVVVGKHNQLPPRVLKPRDNALNMQQWLDSLDEDGRVKNVEAVKRIIFNGGVIPTLRYEVWKFLLGYYPWDSTNAQRQELRKEKVEEYFRMKMQWKSMTEEQEARFSAFHDRKSLIEKDVNRTDRSIWFYSGEDNPNLTLLYDILMTYVMYDFDLGYVQGMSDLLSPILSLMRNEVETFWCFVGFMKKVYRNFDLDQSGMKKQLSQLHTLLSAVEPNLSAFLDEKESGDMFFCFRWLLVWFKREFDHDEIMSLWELLWTGLPCSNFHLIISVAILENEKSKLMNDKYGFTEILKHINELAYKMKLDDIVIKATAIYQQLESSPNLTTSTRRVLGLELGPRNQSTSSDDESIEESRISDLTTIIDPNKSCDIGMDMHYL